MKIFGRLFAVMPVEENRYVVFTGKCRPPYLLAPAGATVRAATGGYARVRKYRNGMSVIIKTFFVEVEYFNLDDVYVRDRQLVRAGHIIGTVANSNKSISFLGMKVLIFSDDWSSRYWLDNILHLGPKRVEGIAI